MSVRWERFAGDTATFAVRLAFHHDPDNGEAASPEMAESWGAFQIWVRGVNLCAHVDGGETLQFSHWYLLPILEWLSANWDPLLHEERPPSAMPSIRTAAEVGGMAAAMALDPPGDVGALATRKGQWEWDQRHALRTARDGGIVPDVRFRRHRDQVEISWTATRLAGAEGIDFLSHDGTEYAAPSAVAEPLYEVLSCAAEWLHKRLPTSERCGALVDCVGALRSVERTEERTAWIAGLGAAWDRIDARWRELRDLGKSLGSPKAFEAAFGSQRSNDNHRSAGSARARRFTLAHELCHLLHDRSQGARLAMASGPWAPKAIEQRANAFAAWLLMPPESLNSAIASAGSPIDSPESVSVVAGRLDVSRATLVEHLYNLGYIHEEARDELRPRVGE